MTRTTLPDSPRQGISDHDETTASPLGKREPTEPLLGDGVIQTRPAANDTPRPAAAEQETDESDSPGRAQWGPLTAPPLSDAMNLTLEAALDHDLDLNPHHTDLVRAAADPAVAWRLYMLLTYTAAHDGRSYLAEGRCFSCWHRNYTRRGLLLSEDREALLSAMIQISREVLGFPLPPTSYESQTIRTNPQSLVRAAYALARDMLEPWPHLVCDADHAAPMPAVETGRVTDWS